MDEILVLEHGRVRERGTHAKLLNDDGLYRHLWDLQNQILADDLNRSLIKTTQAFHKIESSY